MMNGPRRTTNSASTGSNPTFCHPTSSWQDDDHLEQASLQFADRMTQGTSRDRSSKSDQDANDHSTLNDDDRRRDQDQPSPTESKRDREEKRKSDSEVDDPEINVHSKKKPPKDADDLGPSSDAHTSSADDVPNPLIDARLTVTAAESASTNAEQVTETHVDSTESINEIASQLAKRILVSDTSSGNQEVRIELKGTALQDTEVRIAQSQGRIEIEFRTQRQDSRDLLQQNLSVLQQRLTEKVGGTEVQVSLDVKSSTGEQTGDGRSRQRRDLYQEQESSEQH